MPALPAPNDREFSPVPAGAHMAICYRVIDLGTQETTWEGKTKQTHQVLVGWEIPEELMEDGRPFTIGQVYTWSMGEKAKLRAHLEAWRGKAFEDIDFRDPKEGGFDIRKIVGKPCMVTVMHSSKNGNTYANVAGVAKLPKSMLAPAAPQNEMAFLWLSADEFDRHAFDGLSEKLKLKIAKSPEYQAITSGKPVTTDERVGAHAVDDADVPF